MGIFIADEQYKIAVTGTATAGLAVPEILTVKNRRQQVQVEMFASGCGMVVKFGDSTVTADATPDATTKKLPKGNIQVPEGAVVVYAVPANATHVSVISDDESNTGSLWMKIGQGEGE